MSKPLFFSWMALLACGCWTPGKVFTVKQQQKDFRILKTTLLENTGNPYLYTDSLALLKTFDSVQLAIQSPKTDAELFQLYAPLVNKIRCGHTDLFLSKNLWRLYFSSKCYIPGDVKLNGQRLYAKTGIGKNPRIEKGNEIVSINGLAIGEVLARMRLYFASDGYNISLKDRFFSDFFFLYYFLVFGPPQDAFVLDFIDKNGQRLTATINPVFPSMPLMEQKFARNPFYVHPKKKKSVPRGYLRINKDENCCMLTFRSFENAYGKTYEEFLKQSFERINRSKTEFIIVDVRNNLGGRVQSELVTYLGGKNVPVASFTLDDHHKPKYNRHFRKFNKYYRLYRRERRNVRKYAPKGQPYTWEVTSGTKSNNINTTKKIIVLTNGFTFSAASLLASTLKDKCGAVIIGEITGGSYAIGNTGQQLLKLPACKMWVSINPVYVRCSNNLFYQQQGLPPDIEVDESVEWKTKDDPYLKAAFAYIEKNQVNMPEAKKKKMAKKLSGMKLP